MATRKKEHIRIRRLVVITAILGLIIAVIPFALQFGIKKGLTIAGAKQVTLEDVDFNPFTGVLVVKNLRATTSSTQPEIKLSRLAIEIDWLPLFEKHLLIRSLSLHGTDLKVEQNPKEGLIIAGIVLPVSGSEPQSQQLENTNTATEWGIGLGKIELVDNVIQFESPGFSTDFALSDLRLKNLFSWTPSKSADFSFDMQVNKSPISGDLAIFAFSESPSLKGHLKIDGMIIDRYISLAGDALDNLKGQLSTDLAFSAIMEKGGVTYQQSGQIKLNKLKIGSAKFKLEQKALKWDGDVSFSINDKKITAISNGDLLLNGHQSNLSSPELDIVLAALNWSGKTEFQKEGEANKLVINGLAKADNLAINNRATQLEVLKFEKLELQDIAISSIDDIKLSKVLLKKVVVAKKEAKNKTLVETNQITLDRLHIQKTSELEIGKIDIESMTADIDIDKQGKLALLDELINSLSSPEVKNKLRKEQSAKSPQKSKDSSIKIGGIKLHGKSELTVNNGIYSDAVTKTVQLKQLTIGEIDSRSEKKWTPYNLNSTINQHSKLSSKGKLTLFSKKLNLKSEATLKAFELPEFSPPIRQELGYDIQSGQLDAKLKIDIKEGIIDGTTKVEIHGLRMEPADSDRMAKMTQQLAMPLDSALSLLRDENDDINLEIPLKGDTERPDFDISNVINSALAHALQGTAVSYLKYAIQPYGLIYMAAEKAYGATTAISLNAVQFPPGEQALSDESKKYLERIGKLMQKRPVLRIRVCGFATASDRLKLAGQNQQSEGSADQTKAFNAKLLRIAKKRARSVKSHLVSTYKIEASRLFTCLPKVTSEKSLDKAKGPRVELLI